MLEGARAWLGHLPFRARVRASLERQASQLPGVALRWLPASGVARSAVQIVACRGRAPLLLLLSGEVRSAHTGLYCLSCCLAAWLSWSKQLTFETHLWTAMRCQKHDMVSVLPR